jgi:hypothetical protein
MDVDAEISRLFDRSKFPDFYLFYGGPDSDLPPEQRALKEEARRVQEQRRLQQMQEQQLSSPPPSTSNGGLATETSSGDPPAVISSTRPDSFAASTTVGGIAASPHQEVDHAALLAFVSRLAEDEKRQWTEYIKAHRQGSTITHFFLARVDFPGFKSSFPIEWTWVG